MLYLIDVDYKLGTFNIRHRIEIPYHADLIEVVNNRVYIVNLNNYLTICKILGDKLKFIRNIILDSGFQYHGVCKNPNNQNELFLTSTRKYNLLTIINVNTNSYRHFTIPRLENSFLKDAVFVDKNRVLILGSDNGPKANTITYKSYLNLYTYSSGNFTFIDGLTYDNCHMDAVEYKNGMYYVTAQLNDEGLILRGNIEHNFLIPVNSISTVDFPHGLAISPSGYLGYTAYSTCSMYVVDCNNTDLTLP